MKKKFISTNTKIFILILLLLSIVFYTSGCIALVQSCYKLSDYADELHLNPDTFKYNWDFNKFNFDFNASNLSKDYTISNDTTEIDFNLSTQDIKVINYDGDNLKVQIKSSSTLSSELPKIESGNKLILNTRYDTPSDASISVSIPNKFKDKDTLKITTSSGNIDISNLSMNTLNLSSASGDIDVSDLALDYLSLNSSSGNINFNNITASTETKLDSSSGDIIGSGNLGTINGNTSSGDINLDLLIL
jgi:lia operon protein LiaG